MKPIKIYEDCGIQDLAESTVVIEGKTYHRMYRRNIHTKHCWVQYRVKKIDGTWMWLYTPKVQQRIDSAAGCNLIRCAHCIAKAV